MPLFYIPDENAPIHLLEKTFGLSYRELRTDYLRFVLMSDEEWMDNLLDILHFTVFVSYFKELETHHVCQDTGIIHEIIHLMKGEQLRLAGIEDCTFSTRSLDKIRDLFNHDCCIA